MVMTKRECPSCGTYVPIGRITDPWCWERLPLELKQSWWRADRTHDMATKIYVAGVIDQWLRDNPPPAKRERKARVIK